MISRKASLFQRCWQGVAVIPLSKQHWAMSLVVVLMNIPWSKAPPVAKLNLTIKHIALYYIMKQKPSWDRRFCSKEGVKRSNSSHTPFVDLKKIIRPKKRSRQFRWTSNGTGVGGAEVVKRELLSQLINPQWKSFARSCQISRSAAVEQNYFSGNRQPRERNRQPTKPQLHH